MSITSEISAQLKEYFDVNYFDKQVERLRKLNPKLFSTGLVLIGGQFRKDTFTQAEKNERVEKALLTLSQLQPNDRIALFDAIAPSIAKEIEATWHVFDYLPFTTGYNRRPFRLPKEKFNQETYLIRSRWVYQLLQLIKGYNQPVTWFAIWAAHINQYQTNILGYLFAGAMENGGQTGQEVYDILIASANGSHPTAMMGRHVIRGLLCASNPKGWDYVAQLLVTAQREEGLRQVIMESVDEAHPDAFIRLMDVVLEQNLIRFSSIVRAVGVWTGIPLEAAKPKAVQEILTTLRTLLRSKEHIQEIITSENAQHQYLSLCSLAFYDADEAITQAAKLLISPNQETRFITVYFLYQVSTYAAGNTLLPMIKDPDLSTAYLAALGSINHRNQDIDKAQTTLFDEFEQLLARIHTQTKTIPSSVWDWFTISIDRTAIANPMLNLLGKRSLNRLIPIYPFMSTFTQVQVAKLFFAHINEDPLYRKSLLTMVASRDSYVQHETLALIKNLKLNDDEVLQFESYLTRKTDSFRRAVIQLLLNQSDKALLETIDRLLAVKNELQHRAGIELLREMAVSKRSFKFCQKKIHQLREGQLSDTEMNMLSDFVIEDTPAFTLENALGLVDLSGRTKPQTPKSQNGLFSAHVLLGSSAAEACLKALDDLIDDHRSDEIEYKDMFNEIHHDLLGNNPRSFPVPNPQLSMEENLKNLPFREIWEQWWQERPKNLKDHDRLELVRAQAALSLMQYARGNNQQWEFAIPDQFRNFLNYPYRFKLKYRLMVHSVLNWLVYLHPAPQTADFMLNATEEIFFQLSKKLGKLKRGYNNSRQGIHTNYLCYVNLARNNRIFYPANWNKERQARLWRLLLWLEKYVWQIDGIWTPGFEDVLQAFQAGAANQNDLIYALLGQPIDNSHKIDNSENGWYEYYRNQRQFRDLNTYSGKKPHKDVKQYPFLPEIIDQCRDQILKIEMKRGDLPTAASIPASVLRSVPGISRLIPLLKALDKSGLSRKSQYGSRNRRSVLDHLIRVSHPVATDTAEEFAQQVREAKISDTVLYQLAVFAPQWADFIEYTFGWQGFSEGIWWLYAHTRDAQWHIDKEIREDWAAQISEFTPISASELMDGAVDVAWFNHVFQTLGGERWKIIYEAAAYASSGIGHARARLFADAMLDQLNIDELILRITTKRHQDSVRALGLIPLPDGEARQPEILRRYEIIQEFIRTRKKFGSQRQASELLAGTIGLENLARTAGYSDPIRLEWAMELEAVADLAKGPIQVSVDDIVVTLSINDLGETELSCQRENKTLKNIPPKTKKNENVAKLLERKKGLEIQTSRMRASLEMAMIKGDEFTASEIHALFNHPILRVMLEQLIFISENGLGYPVNDGLALDSLGKILPLQPEERLRIAHPYDLLNSGHWHEWQHECFVHERIQPFKQIYRELYVPTDTEQDDHHLSRRYAGQQVNPRQALGLFAARGWVTSQEEGVFKTFHKEGIVARVGALHAPFTPAEVENITIEEIGFTKQGEWKTLDLTLISPRIFSEVMRDLDLVVSVAHAGGIDPEASASSIESRSALITETCELLQLNNIRLSGRHAMIDGKLANYSLHLGSGTVHKQPGGAICIIPVHSQHRGRLFLPFVDNDPKTAEIISKAILLANDRQIKDPTILEQIL